MHAPSTQTDNDLFKESQDTMGKDPSKIKEREHKYKDMVIPAQIFPPVLNFH